MRPSLLRSEEFMAHAMDTWADTVYRIALSHAKSVSPMPKTSRKTCS